MGISAYVIVSILRCEQNFKFAYFVALAFVSNGLTRYYAEYREVACTNMWYLEERFGVASVARRAFVVSFGFSCCIGIVAILDYFGVGSIVF